MRKPCLGDEARAVLGTIVGASQAWLPVASLNGQGAELPGLIDGGWVVLWAHRDGEQATLTPLAAERLGVEIVEAGRAGHLRWGYPWMNLRPIRLPRDGGCHGLEFAELIVDPSPGPLEVLLMDEFSGEPLKLFGMTVPREKPRTVLGKTARKAAARKKAAAASKPVRNSFDLKELRRRLDGDMRGERR